MVQCLDSEERSCFIENCVGDPFAKELSESVKRCLIHNLCLAPYAGALLIYMLDNFEDLSSLQTSKPKQISSTENILA